jgi:hypothetical protein
MINDSFFYVTISVKTRWSNHPSTYSNSGLKFEHMEEQNKQRWMVATTQNRTKKKAGLLFISVVTFSSLWSSHWKFIEPLVRSKKTKMLENTAIEPCAKNSSQKNVENLKQRINYFYFSLHLRERFFFPLNERAPPCLFQGTLLSVICVWEVPQLVRLLSRFTLTVGNTWWHVRWFPSLTVPRLFSRAFERNTISSTILLYTLQFFILGLQSSQDTRKRVSVWIHNELLGLIPNVKHHYWHQVVTNKRSYGEG